jgi:four helix bundle protein
MSDFKKLLVWQKAHAMALSARSIAKCIRSADDRSLRTQIIRAAASVPANIVEGSGQKSAKEFNRFVGIALNSTAELEYHLILARDEKVVREHDSLSLLSQVIEVRKMLYGLQRYLATKI